MKLLVCLLFSGLLILSVRTQIFAQNVGIGTNNPKESAALEIKSFNKGLLIPVMSSTDRQNIQNPAYGLLVFDAVEEGLYWRDTTAWVRITDAQSGFVDSDRDTKIQLEEYPDDDIIRFYTSGNEVMNLNMNRLEFLNNGESVFIGESAGENDDLSLNRNTYVGYRAGQLNQAGTQNVAVGNQALTKSTFGSNNVAVGKQSLFNNIGSNNTALGYNSAGNNTSGTKNTVVGGLSGFANKTGDQNTFLGYEAGRGNITDINGGVMLGHQAGMNEIENDRLYIANDNTSDPLIYGQFDDKTLTVHGMLGINEKNPDAELIVNDNINVDNKSVLARFKTVESEMIFGYNPSNEGILGSVSNHDLRIRTNDVNRLTITKVGDVGIGTSFPDKKLEVRGSVKVQDSISMGPTNPKARLHVRENGNANVRTITGILESSTSKRPTLLFSESPSSTIDNGMSIEYDGAGGGSQNRLRFNKTGGETALTIANGGNVGIGTITPLSQLDIRRTSNETGREQLHLWQAGDGDASLRFSRGFLDLQSFNMGIDGTDDKFKIASSKNNIIGNLNNNTIIELDHNKEVSLKGDLKLDKFIGNGNRALKIQNDGKVSLDEEFGYYAKSIEYLTFFDNDLPFTELDFPHGVKLEEVTMVFSDNDPGKDFTIIIWRGYIEDNNYFEQTVCSFDTEDYGDSPNVRKVTISGNDIFFPEIDNSKYSYKVVAIDPLFGTSSSQQFFSLYFKYSK